MQPIPIDFAPGTRRRTRGGRALLLAAAVLLGAVVSQGGRLLAERSAALSDLREIDADSARALAPPAPARPDLRQVALQRSTRQVASALNTPWAGLLGSLGSTARKDVALLGVEPSVARRSVRLTAEARDDTEMLSYLAALQHDPRLSSVVLASHQEQVQSPGTPVRFTIQAQWGGTP